jgi:transcription termination factor NusB
MKRSIAAIAVLLACGASAGLGYWYGMRQGWHLGIAADFMPRGAIAIYQLGLLKAGKPDNVIIGLESDVDNGLTWGHEILQHPMREVWRPLWGFEVYPEYEKYVVRMARYRKEHPSPFKPDAFDTVPPGKEQHREFYKELAKGARENKAKIDAMVERYATKP